MSAATSHSAHLYHLPLPFSFCWQIKIHGLPSHPFSLHCLIVSKIEEITGRNFCTNKNLSGTWQCVTWHTHTCAWGIPLWIAGGIPQNPNLLSFLLPPPGSSCWAIKKSATEGRATLEGRKIPHCETDREHTSSLRASCCRLASSFLEGHIIIVVTGSTRTLELCDFNWSISAIEQKFHVPLVELMDFLPLSLFASSRLQHLVPDDSHSEKEWITVSSGYQQTLICAFWNNFYIFRHLTKAANSLEINMRPSWQQWLAAELTFGLHRISEPGARMSILTSQHFV